MRNFCKRIFNLKTNAYRNWQTSSLALLALVFSQLTIGCNNNSRAIPDPLASKKFSLAIERVLKEDENLGSQRNHDAEKMSLVAAIDRYIAGMEKLDWQDCPATFIEAFELHQEAWESSKSLFEKFPDLRGEMHGLFDKIRDMPEHNAALLQVEKDIWGTWAEVENVARKFDVMSNLAEESQNKEKTQ